jgi:hypothetical protein
VSNQGEPVSRIRIRPIGTEHEKKVISRQNCLAVPHFGEAIDRFNNEAFFGRFDLEQARELHEGHMPWAGNVSYCTDRCCVIDAVDPALPVGPDEITVK